MTYLFVHGLGQTASGWEKTIERFKGSEGCVCPDLPGLLRGKDVNYSDLYKAFSRYCDNCAEPVHICGLSLGGILALNYGIDHPDKVHSLVLAGTQYKMPVGLLKFQNAVFRLLPPSVFVQTGFGKKDFIALSKSMMALDFSKELPRLSCPVMVVCGQKDTANRKAANGLAGGIHNAELQIIKNAGHEINADAPEQLADLLNDFYERIENSSRQ